MAFNLIKGFINTVQTKRAEFKEEKKEKLEKWAENDYKIDLKSEVDAFVKSEKVEDIVETYKNKISQMKETTEIIGDTLDVVKDAVKFTFENREPQVKELLNIYTKGGTQSLLELGVTMIKANMEEGAYLDISNIVQDLIDVKNECIPSREEGLKLLKDLQKHANFAVNGEYKNYLAEEDKLTQTKEGIETAQTCLNVCDYMNMGTTAGVTHIDSWTCVSEGDEQEKNAETGFWGKAYINEETKQIIVGFCATNSLSDWGTDDVQMVKGEVPEQYEDALAFYNKYANDEKYADYEKVITGHSMGGSLGQLVGSTEGVNVDKVIAFNPFGTYEIQNNQDDKYNFVNNNSKIFNFVNEYDIVSCAARHVGQTTLLDSISVTVVGNHLLDTMHSYLSDKRDELA